MGARIAILEKRVDKLENEEMASAQNCRCEENERVKALEKETARMKSEREELKKKLFEKTKEEKQFKSKQRMHFAMVDACISNMIKEKETPQSLISSLNLLKRCSQQFIEEDSEKEEPLKKRMKKESSEEPEKQEIKEEYFEQFDDVLVKNEEEEEEEEEEYGQSTSSNGPSNNSTSANPTEESILDANLTFERNPCPPVEAKTHDRTV